MKVNMTPNPLDVVTIHASQGDTEARQWGFELHNNGELIDTSEITEQLFFKAYKGGTEQLLPENGSTPTTSPFLGDIKYPQGLLTDQEFLYRESPTESNGLAKITDIKGNTLVWNQLVDTDTSSVTLTSGHKFITKVNGAYSLVDGTGQSLSVTGGTDEVFDLTKMGVDFITSTDEFTSLFPLSYYSYNQGSLLSFNGNGLKTTGKNLFDENSVLLSQGFVKQNDGSYFKSALMDLSNVLFWENTLRISGEINIKYQYKYINGTGSSGLRPLIRYTDGTAKYNYPTVATDFTSFSFQTDPTKTVDKILWDYGSSGNSTYIKDFIISVDNISYEPYTSSTLSLPISTYFPSGMKSAGNVYDELTESKAITRVGSRAYQSGDESDTSVITDGTTTYYALVNPTETSFTTASLVTENAEITLSNEDGTLIGKCTEQLSENPGFIDAKIKLADSDGECYSNKLQLHVERSPQ